MRALGDIVNIPEVLIQSYSIQYPKKSLYQHKGFALDEVEKKYYVDKFKWTATKFNEPYDVFYPLIYADFKLCTSKSLTIQNSECSFGDKNKSYVFFIYAIEADGLSACFVGQTKYSDISKYLQPSRDPSSSSKFCFLDEIQHLIS